VRCIGRFGPLSGAAANITLFSYRGGCGIGVSTDQQAVPDPGVFRECLEDGIGLLRALTEAPEMSRRRQRLRRSRPIIEP